MPDNQILSDKTTSEQTPVETIQQPQSLWYSIVSNGFNLSILAMGMAATLAIAYISTQEQILTSYEAAKSKALLEVVPSAWLGTSSYAYPMTMPNPQQLNQTQDSIIYVLQQQERIKGWVIPTSTNNGYNGRINLLVGINTQGKVTGVRVTQHQETPGLGDKIERKKSPWIDSFIDTNLQNTVWKVQKEGGDFDQFTGATITPRALVKQVQQTLVYYQTYKTTLMELAQSQDKQPPLTLDN